MLDKIGKYEIRLQIGRGAMGIVYEGFDPVIGRRVAVKTLRTEFFEPSQLSNVLARFKREAQSAGRLSHPHIVTIHDYGEEDGTPYIVMEFMSGTELGVHLERGSRFSPEEIVRLMTQLLGALGNAHEQGVVHRDLKPANMFLLQDGSLKVVDFGIAHVEASDLTDTGAMLGTPAYMSPEQCLGIQVDHRSDIFSAGVILYQLLTGDKPFTGSITTIIQKVMRHDPLPPSELNPTISSAWDKVVARAMAKKPEARYESARHFAEAIKLAHQTKWDMTVAIEVKDAKRERGEGARQMGQAQARGEAEARANALAEPEAKERHEMARLAEELRRENERAEADARAKREAGEQAAREASERVRQTIAAAVQAEEKSREEARRERERAEAEAKAQREAAAPAASAAREPGKRNTARAPAIAVALIVAGVVLVAVLFSRQGAEDQGFNAEATRVAAEARVRDEMERRENAEALARAEVRVRDEVERRQKAEALAREQAGWRSILEAEAARKEAEAKREAEFAAKARAQGEATKATEAKALALKREEEEHRKAELAAKEEAEAKAKAEIEGRARREAEQKAKAETARKTEEARREAQKPEVLVKERQAAMILLGKYFGPLGGMAQGKSPFNKAVAARNAGYLEVLTKMPWDGFDASTANEKNRALPQVYEDAAKFKQVADSVQDAISKLAAATRGGDEVAVKLAIGAVGKTCGGCHDNFRQK